MQNEIKKTVPAAVLARLPRYYRFLRTLLRDDIFRISSSELSRRMGVTASQIRQDLSLFGGFGQQGYGYNVKYLYGKLCDILGVTSNYPAVIIGAGELGRALSGDKIFEKRSVRICALFDMGGKEGRTSGGVEILPAARLRSYYAENPFDIAVLACSDDEIPTATELLCGLGIKGVWNFSNTELESDEYEVQNVCYEDGLMLLCCRIKSAPELQHP